MPQPMPTRPADPGGGRAPRPVRAVQRWCAALAALTLAAGLALQLFERDPLVDLAGSALYTAFIGLLIACLAPRWPARRPALLAVAVSAAIELAQLTGVPAVLVEAMPPLRFVFGSSFDAFDLLGYAVGGLLVWGVRRAIGPAAPAEPQHAP
ncbi:ribosomal maturation YjgA family protein [Agromyces soli]